MIFEMGRRFVHRLSHECYTQGFNEKFTSSNPIRSHASVKQCRGFIEFPGKSVVGLQVQGSALFVLRMGGGSLISRKSDT